MVGVRRGVRMRGVTNRAEWVLVRQELTSRTGTNFDLQSSRLLPSIFTPRDTEEGGGCDLPAAALAHCSCRPTCRISHGLVVLVQK